MNSLLLTENEVGILKDYFNGDYDDKLPANLQKAADDFQEGLPIDVSIHVLSCDEPWKAMRGYLVFNHPDINNGVPSKDLLFQWQFAAEVTKVKTLSVTAYNGDSEYYEKMKSDIKRVEDELKRIFGEDGWVEANDPKNLMVGLIKYAAVGKGESEGVKVHVTLIKALSEEVRAGYNNWRAGAPDMEAWIAVNKDLTESGL